MKKILISFLILFAFFDFVLFVSLFLPRGNKIERVDNEYVSFDVLDGYYLNCKSDVKSSRIQLLGYDDVSSINVDVLQPTYSIDNLFPREVSMLSLNYQILRLVSDYVELESEINDNSLYTKGRSNDEVIEVYIEYKNEKWLVVSYITTYDKYNDLIVSSLSKNIVIK